MEAGRIGETVQTVSSRDGTPIAFETIGSGPGLVLVHGTAGSRGRWGAALPMLATQFTVYMMDRRGRGDSGDAPAYAFEREFEDVAAVIDAVEAPVSLLGHSFGAIAALEAALLTDVIDKMILYEPPLAASNTRESQRANADLEAKLAAGDLESVVTTFLRDIAGMPEAAIDRMRGAPSWEARLAAAHTLPREHRAVSEYELQPGRFSGLEVPTLLLLGGASPALYATSVRMIDEALPNSQVVVLPGQQHVAMDTAPDLFVNEIATFLGS